MTNGRVPVRWPRAKYPQEREAFFIARRCAGRLKDGMRDWRHADAPRLVIGGPDFHVPIVAGHVVMFMTDQGASDDEIERVLAGDVDASRLAELYARAREWVVAWINTWSGQLGFTRTATRRSR